MADKELTRLETLKKKRKEYDDQRIKAEKDFQQARKKGDDEAERDLGKFIGQRRRGIELLDSQIKKEEKIAKYDKIKLDAQKKQNTAANRNKDLFDKMVKSREKEQAVIDKKKEILDEINKTEKDRKKLIEETVSGARNMNSQILGKLNLERQSEIISGLMEQGRKKEAELLKDVGDHQLELLGIKTRQQLLEFDSAKALEDIADLQFEIAQLEQDILDGKVENKDKAQALVESMKHQMKISGEILDQTSKRAKEAQAEKAAADKLKESSMDLVDAAEKHVLFAKELVKELMKNPYLILAAGAMAVVKALSFMNEKTKEFQEKIGGSVTQGKQLRNELLGAQVHAKALGYDAAAAAGALTEEFGSLKSVNSEVVMAMGRMEKGLGVSVATSAKLLASMTSLTGKSQASAVATMEFGASLAMANDVAPGAVMEDIAGNTEAFAAYGKDGGKNMIKAAVAARKLGLELGTMVKISDSLLEFETSIQNEMEASMLIGKQLNYNKARELALSGDLEGATKNVMDQIGGAAEFQKMNVMQRKALADSIGVSVEEMSALASGKVEMKQPDKTSEEQLKDSMDDSKLTMMNLITTDNALKVAVGILTVAIGLNTLSQGKLGGMFKNFGKGGFMKGAKSLGSGALKGAKAVGGGALKGIKALGSGALKGVTAVGSGALKGVAAVGKGAKALGSGAKMAASVGTTAIKSVTKGAGKALLKKIPGIGLVAGLGFAASRLMKGDALGALGEVASGAASIIPGIGTAVSTAIDVGMIARDASKAAKETAETAQDATRVQIAEKKNIIKTEKSANALRAEAIQAEKAAKDAIVIQKKEAEKQSKAKAVEAKQIKVKPVVPETRSKEELEAELATKRALRAQQQQAALNAKGGMEKRRTRQDLARTNTDINKLIAAIEAQTTAIKEGTEKQVKATKDMVND